MKSISPILGCSCALWGAIIAALNWQLPLALMFLAMAAVLLATAYGVKMPLSTPERKQHD